MRLVALCELEVRDFRQRLVVMKNHGDSVTPSKKTPHDRGIPGLEKRETWGTPGFPRSTFKDNSRYTRAGDVGHPPDASFWGRFVPTEQCNILSACVLFVDADDITRAWAWIRTRTRTPSRTGRAGSP